MRSCLLIIGLSCLLTGFGLAQEPEIPLGELVREKLRNLPEGDETKRVPPIATSGSLEIESIRVERQQVTDSVFEVDLNGTQIAIWLAGEADDFPEWVQVKIGGLGPVEDDMGKSLLPEKRKQSNRILREPVSSGRMKSARGKSGPVVSLRLDAPAREAKTIRSLKGKAIISQTRVEQILLKDAASLSGKPIADARFKDFPITPVLKVENGDTILKLTLPAEHARLQYFGLIKMNREATLLEQEESTEEKTVTITKIYLGDQTKGTSLGITLAQPSEETVYEFDFKDIALP